MGTFNTTPERNFIHNGSKKIISEIWSLYNIQMESIKVKISMGMI